MLASSKSSLQEAEDSIARLEMRLEQYEIHMARGGSSDRVAANELTQARSAYERAKAVRDEIRGVPANDAVAIPTEMFTHKGDHVELMISAEQIRSRLEHSEK